MQLTPSLFNDPSARAGLQQYYESKKAAAVEAWKARESQPLPDEVSIAMPDGTTHAATLIPITAEQMEKALVSFDTWVEIMAQTYDTSSRNMEMAQERVDRLEELNPDNSSQVRSTFSANGSLLAYVTAEGTLVTSNGAEALLGGIQQKADAMGLSGENRVDYMNREIKAVLGEKYPALRVAAYGEGNSPSIRDFARMWSHGYNADQVYTDAMTDAKAHLAELSAWHQNWQNNLNEMQSFLLGLQEVG